MVAYSSNCRTHFANTGVGPGLGPPDLPWDFARIATRTIGRELIMQYDIDRGAFVDRPRWKALSFFLEYRGVSVGQGQLS